MAEHAVFWRDSAATGTLFGGGVAIEGNGIRLRGSDGRTEVIETLPGNALAAVRPSPGDGSIAGFPSIRLDLQSGRTLVVAAALGTSALLELVNNILTLLAGG